MTAAAIMAPGRGIGGLGGWLSMAPQTDDAPMATTSAVEAGAGQDADACECNGAKQDLTKKDEGERARNAPGQSHSPSIVDTIKPGVAAAHAGQFSPPYTSTSPRIHSPLVPKGLRRASFGCDQSKLLQKKPVTFSTLAQTSIDMSPRASGSSEGPRRQLPRTNAKFSIGSGTSSFAGTPSSLAPSSPRSGDGDDSPPPFDVRASFAPMPKYGERDTSVPSNARRRKSAPGAENGLYGMNGTSGGRLMQNGAKIDYALRTEEDEDEAPLKPARTNLLGKPTDRIHLHDEEGDYNMQEHSPDVLAHDDDEDDDGHCVEIAGRKYKGKTANAIELEMEALGDHTVMSYAPDAVYLASRLEGLRRNLEAGGERTRRPAWQDEEDAGDGHAEPHTRPHVATPPPSKALYRKVSDAAQRKMEPMTATAAVVEPARNDEVMDVEDAPVVSPKQPSQDTEQERAAKIDPAAREAALDARVEIRTLRRPDLEQVRELHCYHGDGDKVDADTYTTSAAFLLRLLVDEHYVCLVAVAKPLPEPAALPSQFEPYCPPPSLDMPPAKSPFLLAGRNTTPRRNSLLASTGGPIGHLTSTARINAFANDAPAPRSFGAGPDSDNASSSVDDESDEERRRQSSLFEQAKATSTHVTGETSPPENEAASSENGDEELEEAGANARANGLVAVAEEQLGGNEHEIQHSRTPSHDTLQALSKRTSFASRPSRTILAGPTFDVAPPRAIRVMGAPPPGGVPAESETILGVAAARIKVVQRSEDEWGGGSGLYGPTTDSTSKDSSWPGMDPRGEAKTVVTREAHILSLSVLPGERGQGLGARLLNRLMDECKRRTAGPRIQMAPGSTITEEETTQKPGEQQDLSSAPPTTAAPPRAHQNAPMRTVLEMHPSNAAAMTLYTKRGFTQIPGNRGVARHFFRGDQRIPARIRLQVGGSDGVRLERREDVV